jgi:hypothetical protein
MEGTHLAWTKSIYISFPLALKGDGSAGSCCAAEPAPPSTAPDITKNVTVAAVLLILARSIIDNRVDPASEEFPVGTAMLGNVIVVSTLPHGNVEVPCYDKTIAGACVDNTFGGRAADELGGSVEGEGGDAKAMARFVVVGGMEGRLGMLYSGDQDGVE